jgi:peroxiredoxin
MLCRKSASELTQIKPVLDQLGVKLVAIGSGTPAMAKNFVEEFKFAGEIYTDESRKIYNDFQCKRGWSKAMFNKKTLKFIKTAFTEGYAQGKTQGDLT